MARLSSGNAFKRELYQMGCIDKFGQVLTSINQLNIALERSTVDAVEVVRCRDCKYRRIKQDWFGNNGEELAKCKQWDAPISDMNGFCSWGERREDEQ